MKVEDIISLLHPIERKILRHLAKVKKDSSKNISKSVKISLDAVYKGSRWLEEKNLVKIHREKKEEFVLTEKGRKVLERGLPEKRLIDILKNKECVSIKEVLDKNILDKDELNYTIGFLKRSNVILFEKGVICIKKLDNNIIERIEELDKLIRNLEKYSKGDIKKEVLDIALSRGLIKVEKRFEEFVEITHSGEKIAKKLELEEVEEKDEIGLLTIEVIEKEEWKQKKFRKYNIYEDVGKINIGKKNPYEKFLYDIKLRLVELGFKEMNVDQPIIEFNFFNCDALFMPQDHPARDIHDIFFVDLDNVKKSVPVDWLERVELEHKRKWGYFNREESKKLVLRSHTTAVSARLLYSSNLEIPGKYFCISRVFRPDTIDWKHFIEFCQLEGIVIGEELNFKNLLGLLKTLIQEIIGVEKVKFRPGYFPFTEPSVEAFTKFEGKWVEVGGAGIFREEVVKPALGRFVPVLAWGLGIDRLFMAKYNLKDIRDLYTRDIENLRNLPVL